MSGLLATALHAVDTYAGSIPMWSQLVRLRVHLPMEVLMEGILRPLCMQVGSKQPTQGFACMGLYVGSNTYVCYVWMLNVDIQKCLMRSLSSHTPMPAKACACCAVCAASH